MKTNRLCMLLVAFLLNQTHLGHAEDSFVLTDTHMSNVTAGSANSEPFTKNDTFPDFQFSIVIPIFLTISSANIAVSTSTSSVDAANSLGGGTGPMGWFVPYQWSPQTGLRFGGF